jgi:hypothetical protein
MKDFKVHLSFSEISFPNTIVIMLETDARKNLLVTVQFSSIYIY